MKTGRAIWPLTLLGALALGGCSLGVASSNGNSAISPGASSGKTVIPSSSDGRVFDSGTYANAILPLTKDGREYKGEIADPSSVVKGSDGYYYVFSTLRKCFRSSDLCTWYVHSESVIDRPTWGDAMATNPEVWAPDVIKIGGRWIYYYALSAWGEPCGIGYATAEDPAGPWTDQGCLFQYSELGIDNAIDPCVYVEEDGSVYMASGSFQGIYLFQLTEDGRDLEGSKAYQKAHKTLIAGTDYEGSYLVKRNGYYYLYLSAGSCCEGLSSTYRVYVGRSAKLQGPYLDEKGNPLTASVSTATSLVLWAGVGSSRQVIGPGHNSIFQDDKGQDWLIYHSYADLDDFATRHLMMDKLVYDEGGFPAVEGKKPSYEEELDGPSLEVL
jgi:arabinan endo-1,5-alpha-L-arabinosidase